MTSPETYEKRVAAILLALGIPASYGADSGVPFHREATDLVSVGADIYGRDQRLTPEIAVRWPAMQAAAARQGISLLLVSAFRSVDDQRRIWERKLAAGQSVAQILRVNAPPGYSEHHTGRAIDLTAPGCEPLSEEFEGTPEFAWLVAHAGAFGFSMPYARHNRYGFIYEPWHWSALESVAEEGAQARLGRAANDPRAMTESDEEGPDIWELRCGETLLATINVTHSNFPWKSGAITTTESFEAFRHLFVEHRDRESASAARAELQRRGVVLLPSGGRPVREFVLQVSGQEAGFQFR